VDKILKDFADENKNKFLSAKATFVSQATIARSAPIWFVRTPVIVLLGADFSFMLSLLCSIIIQGCTVVLCYVLLSRFFFSWCFVSKLLYLYWLIISSSVVGSF